MKLQEDSRRMACQMISIRQVQECTFAKQLNLGFLIEVEVCGMNHFNARLTCRANMFGPSKPSLHNRTETLFIDGIQSCIDDAILVNVRSGYKTPLSCLITLTNQSNVSPWDLMNAGCCDCPTIWATPVRHVVTSM